MKLLLTTIILTFATIIPAQQSDRWKELVIDESTPEQAIQKFGKPIEDEPVMDKYVKFRMKHVKKKDFRTLLWRDLEGFKEVKFVFKEDKLVVIWLQQPQQVLSAHTVAKAYSDITFSVYNSGTTLSSTFEMQGVSERSVIWATLVGRVSRTLTITGGNSEFGEQMNGNIFILQISSRTIYPNIKNPADLLK